MTRQQTPARARLCWAHFPTVSHSSCQQPRKAGAIPVSISQRRKRVPEIESLTPDPSERSEEDEGLSPRCLWPRPLPLPPAHRAASGLLVTPTGKTHPCPCRPQKSPQGGIAGPVVPPSHSPATLKSCPLQTQPGVPRAGLLSHCSHGPDPSHPPHPTTLSSTCRLP